MTRDEVLEEFGYYAAGSYAQEALQAPDRETVEAALEAEWAHGRAEPDATRRTSARAALIGVARHLRERLGL
jgi:hypothetical protein